MGLRVAQLCQLLLPAHQPEGFGMVVPAAVGGHVKPPAVQILTEVTGEVSFHVCERIVERVGTRKVSVRLVREVGARVLFADEHTSPQAVRILHLPLSRDPTRLAVFVEPWCRQEVNHP